MIQLCLEKGYPLLGTSETTGAEVSIYPYKKNWYIWQKMSVPDMKANIVSREADWIYFFLKTCTNHKSKIRLPDYSISILSLPHPHDVIYS